MKIYDPYERIEKFRKKLEKLFRDKEVSIFTIPSLKVYKENKNIVYELPMQEFSKDEIKIDVNDLILTIKAKKNEKKSEKSFILPEGAVIDEITAEYKNGTLKITVPVDKKKQKRSIEIK